MKIWLNILAPNAVPGGKKNVPILATNTIPRPIASGPYIFKNFSEGAEKAIRDKPKIK